MKSSMKDALKSSIKTEEQHINDRFAKADSLLARPTKTGTTKPVVVVRDTFSMPQDDNEMINQVRLRCMKAGIDTTRSEIVRAAIHQLAKLSQEDLEKTVGEIEKIKPGPQKRNGRTV